MKFQNRIERVSFSSVARLGLPEEIAAGFSMVVGQCREDTVGGKD